MKKGLFVGLVTLDLIYLAEHPPMANQKMVAMDYAVSAGGPATNAAIAFRFLGNSAMILGAIGCHAITHLILTDLQQWQVEITDLTPERLEPPPVSSIVVTQATGARSVISINAVKTQATIADYSLEDVGVVLIDGHQIAVGRTIAQQAKAQNIPVVMDGGSWKSGFETILPFVDYAICSANFQPPGCTTDLETIAYLANFGISQVAITQGEQPILYCQNGRSGKIVVPTIQAVDTLGAGDIFHGAFCHFILHQSFLEALASAAKVAARSCQFFGTRRWMESES
jgi:sugar/nucleoside kinase (ribokinase family)